MRVLPLSREAVGVFCCPSWLGHSLGFWDAHRLRNPNQKTRPRVKKKNLSARGFWNSDRSQWKWTKSKRQANS